MIDFEEIKSKLAERGSSKEDFEEKVDILNRMAYDIRTENPEKSLSIAQVALDTSEKINYANGRANALFNRAFANRKLMNYEEALKGYKEAATAFGEIGDKLGQGRSVRACGKTLKWMFRHRESIEHLSRSLELFEELDETYFQAEALSEMADSYHVLNELAAALEQYLKALELYTKADDKARLSAMYNRVAVINMQLGETQEALEYYKKSLELKRQLGDRINEALTLNNIGLICENNEGYDQALKYFNQALVINDEIGEKINGAICKINIADVLIKQEKLDEAEKVLNEAKEILEPSREKNYKAHLYLSYAKLYTQKKEYYDAIHLVNDAIAIANEIEAKDLILDSYMCYSECHSGLLDFEKAHEYFKKYYDLKNEIFNKEMYEKIKNLQYKYERETALKEAETQKKRGQELEKALKQVEELNENLQKMNEEKNTFMALVAHDLKNPLNAVLGYAQLVRANPQQFSETEYKEMFNDIEVSARIMTELITNYLEFTTIEAGKVELDMREIDISKIARYVTDSFASRADSKKIILEYNSNPPEININADKNALMQILDNLVSNAVKFSNPGKRVILSLSANDSTARCVVTDEGPGISPEDMQKLFKKFSRLSARPTAGESSTGLGLSIAKKLTEDMNGNIWCESEEGKGTSFLLEFQLSK